MRFQIFLKRQAMTYAKKRYFTYALITLIALVLPFIRINGNHFFLLSFDHKKLNILFTSFDMQELYLMPFLLVIFFLSIFFVTTLGGRVWCGWSCPQSIFRVIFRDLIQTKILGLRSNIRNKQTPAKKNAIKQAISVILFAFIAAIAASNLMWYFIPPEDFFAYLQNPAEHKLLFGIVTGFTLFLIFDVCFLAENFCVYVCPYARIQSVMFDHDTIQVIYDEKRGGIVWSGKEKLGKKPSEGECIGCEACVAICPTHIDIRRGMQLECINCLECADACAGVMAKKDQPSLISWTSAHSLKNNIPVQYFRFRTIAYIVFISAFAVALGFMSTKKENMLLNINRTTELYKIAQIDGKPVVQNAYTFLVQNTQNEAHEYYFSVSDPRIEIQRPKANISLAPGSKQKVVVVLQTKQRLANDAMHDVPLDITITAFAVDDPEKIKVERSTRFVYPKLSEIEGK